MVNEVALVLLWGLFGPGIALVYMAAGLAVAIVGGLVIGRLRMERYVEDYVWALQGTGGHGDRDQADLGGSGPRRLVATRRTSSGGSCPTSSSGSGSARSSTASCRPSSSSRSADPATRWRSRSSS